MLTRDTPAIFLRLWPCGIRAHCLAQVDTLWEEVTRFENPHSYYVDLSQKLWDEKNRLLSENQY